jgi:hypothetical protein
MKAFKIVESRADPCLSFEQNKKSQAVVIAVLHLDDNILGGHKKEIKGFKQEIKMKSRHTNQGKLKTHLGI